MTTRPRIDSLSPDTAVTLKMGKTVEPAVFLGIEGTDEERTAAFAQTGQDGTFRWSAYRFRGVWVFGSDATPLSLVSVTE